MGLLLEGGEEEPRTRSRRLRFGFSWGELGGGGGLGRELLSGKGWGGGKSFLCVAEGMKESWNEFWAPHPKEAGGGEG